MVAAPITDENNDAQSPKRDGSEPLKGREFIASKVKHLPHAPGVYRMIGEKGEILYVGKAKSLRNRVTSYSRPTGHTNRI